MKLVPFFSVPVAVPVPCGMFTVFTVLAVRSFWNCVKVRFVDDVPCSGDRKIQRKNATMIANGSSECRQAGGGGGVFPGVGLSPGGGVEACLLIGRTLLAGCRASAAGGVPVLGYFPSGHFFTQHRVNTALVPASSCRTAASGYALGDQASWSADLLTVSR